MAKSDPNVSNEGWEPMARDLMRRKWQFTVPDWDDSENSAATALTREFDYNVHIDVSGGMKRPRAIFTPNNDTTEFFCGKAKQPPSN